MSSAQSAGYITSEFNTAIGVFNTAAQTAQSSHRRFVLSLLACAIVLLIVRRSRTSAVLTSQIFVLTLLDTWIAQRKALDDTYGVTRVSRFLGSPRSTADSLFTAPPAQILTDARVTYAQSLWLILFLGASIAADVFELASDGPPSRCVGRLAFYADSAAWDRSWRRWSTASSSSASRAA